MDTPRTRLTLIGRPEHTPMPRAPHRPPNILMTTNTTTITIGRIATQRHGVHSPPPPLNNKYTTKTPHFFPLRVIINVSKLQSESGIDCLLQRDYQSLAGSPRQHLCLSVCLSAPLIANTRTNKVSSQILESLTIRGRCLSVVGDTCRACHPCLTPLTTPTLLQVNTRTGIRLGDPSARCAR